MFIKLFSVQVLNDFTTIFPTLIPKSKVSNNSNNKNNRQFGTVQPLINMGLHKIQLPNPIENATLDTTRYSW